MSQSIESAYRLADDLMDTGDEDAAKAINFCAGTALNYRKHLITLAWACAEKNSAKRRERLQIFLMEMDAAGESMAPFPMRERS